jgi:hypothetical protein
MTGRQREALSLLSTQRVEPPPASRGRLLHVDDIQELLGKRRDGTYRYTPRWIREHVARERQIKIGRDVAVYEADFHAWLEENMRAAS